MKKRIGDAFMPVDEYGRSLPDGVGLNILLAEVAPMAEFLCEVLEARLLYADEDFAALDVFGSPVMLHADHTYLDHPLHGVVSGVEARGVGLEIRVYGCDPDMAESTARQRGDVILSGSIDKPHGLRECHIVGPEGYVFVPSRSNAQHHA